MMRDRFIDDLNRLETLNFDMFRMGEQSLSLLCQLLTNRDASLDNKIAAYEGAMDEKKRQIESLALALILREQPVAQDLALITSSMGVVVDLERISDQARDIAELMAVPKQLENKAVDHLANLADHAFKMYKLARKSYVERSKCAEILEEMDDSLDHGFEQIKEFFQKDPTPQDLDLLLVAQYLERIGDHCVNIGEWVDQFII